jgi:periplasmic protein TonB
MALAGSALAHGMVAIALSTMIWRSAPEEPVYTPVSLMYEPISEQKTTLEEPAEPTTEAQPTAPERPTQQAETEPPAQAEPPPPPERQIQAETHAEPETPSPPMPPTDTMSDPVTPVPVVPPPQPAMELPPSAAPPPKPPSHVAMRPQPVRPSPRAVPMPAQTAERNPPGHVTSPNPTTPQAVRPDPSVLASWNAMFSAWLASRKTYPEVARRRGEQGSVTLRFTVAGDGEVVQVALVAGSGSRILDESALALLRNAHLPRPETEITRTVRVQYQLED